MEEAGWVTAWDEWKQLCMLLTVASDSHLINLGRRGHCCSQLIIKCINCILPFFIVSLRLHMVVKHKWFHLSWINLPVSIFILIRILKATTFCSNGHELKTSCPGDGFQAVTLTCCSQSRFRHQLVSGSLGPWATDPTLSTHTLFTGWVSF